MTEINEKWVPDCIYNEWIKYRPIANAGVVIVNPEKQVLLLKRKKGSTKDEWEIPSGGIEKCEEPIGTALRELEEETGNVLRTEQLKEIITVTAPHPNDRTDIVTTFLAYPVTIRHTKLGCEHSAVRWLPLHEYSTKDIRMHEATRKQIKAAYCYVF